MKQIRNIHFIGFFLLLVFGTKAQNLQISTGHSSGAHLYEGETITAPGTGANQVGISGSGQVDYKATNLINLKEGFEAGGFSGNGFFHAYIAPHTTDYSGGLLDNTSFENIQPSTSKAVGYTPGASNVSPTGAATYSIPIQLPPGTNGMVPSLSINYNNQAGNGILGMGWSLGGISAITRVPKTIYHNGSVSPVKLDNTDDYSLDGSRLILVDGVYHTEQESFSKITANSMNSYGPQGFTVIAKNGITTEYGLTDDSRFKKEGTEIVLFWLVNKVYDQYGNYVKYIYKQENNEIVLDRVLYTGNDNAGLSPYNVVKFKYEPRQDKSLNYGSGIPIRSNLLLSEITIVADGLFFKTSKFYYGFSLYSFLTKIVEIGSDGSELNPTFFKYGECLDPITIQTSNITTGDYSDLYTLDFNGDGLTDVLSAVYHFDSEGFKYHSSYELFLKENGSETFSNPINVTLPSNIYKQKIAGKDKDIHSQSGFIPSDFNGDNFADLLIASIEIEDNGDNNSSNNFHYVPNLSLHAFNGNDFVQTPLSLPTYINRIHQSNKWCYVGDFDGDGTADYLTLLLEYNNEDNCHAYISFPNRQLFNIPIESSSLDALKWVKSKNIIVIDFDGDCKNEIIVINEPNENELYTKVYTFNLNIINNSITYQNLYTGQPGFSQASFFGEMVADFNGDGNTDILHENFNPTNFDQDGYFVVDWFIEYGNGKDGYEQQQLQTKFLLALAVENGLWSSIVDCNIGDFNSDNKSDVLISYFINEQETKFDIYFSNGNGFLKESNSVPLDFQEKSLISGDFNGDGNTDQLVYKEGYQLPLRFVLINENSTELFLEKLKDGFGRITRFNYSWMPKESNYTPQSTLQTYPLSNFQPPWSILSSISTPDGIGGIQTISFKFFEATLHKEGKGFLGFKKISTSSSSSGLTSETNFGIYVTNDNKYFASYMAGQKSSLTASPTELISSSENTYSFLPITDPQNKIYWPRLEKTVQNDFLNSFGSETNNEYWNDGYGNLKKSTKTYTGSNQIDKVSYSEYVDNGSHIPWLPKYKLTETTLGNTFTKKTKFEYTNQGAVQEVTEFCDKQNSVTTEYSEFNVFGNNNKLTISSQGLPTKIVKATFDPKGRFRIKSTNVFDQNSESMFDPRWGTPIWEKDITGLVSTAEYDGWGRLIKTTDFHGNESTVNYDWATGVDNALFTVTSHVPASPENKIYYDLLGREVKSKTKGFANIDVFTDKSYDSRGNILSETTPYSTSESSSPPVTTTYQYDLYNRPLTISNPVGNTTFSYAATGGRSTTTVTDMAGNSTSKTYDATGKVVSTSDNGGTLDYSYQAEGLYQTLSGGTTLVTIGYNNDYGWQNSLNDINAGLVTYSYNSYNQLISQTDPLGITTTYDFDVMGRCTTKTYSDDGQTLYTYYNSGNGLNQIKKAQAPDGSYQEFSYDGFGRPIMFKEKKGNYSDVFTTSFAYNDYDQLTSSVSPSGFVSYNSYDGNGYLTNIRDAANHSIFTTVAENAMGQLISYSLGNGKTTTKTYNQYGFLEHTLTSGIQDLETIFNNQNGNLESRQDNIKGWSESFTYDNLDRLTKATPSSFGTGSLNPQIGPWEDNVTYSTNGNITSKTALGQFHYENTDHPNAVSSVDNYFPLSNLAPISPIRLNQQEVSYHHDRPNLISENGYEYCLKYGVDEQRLVTELKQNGTLISRRFYSLNYEKLELGNDIFQIDYICGSDGLAAIHIKKNNDEAKYYYVYKDHLGSLVALTDENGDVKFEQNFDAWGNRRNADTWEYYNSSEEGFKWLNRGFTGHEHLPEFGLINMNARLYDPLVGRFLAVDNLIQHETSTQGYNRYSYCFNNPLKHTDPSGEITVDFWTYHYDNSLSSFENFDGFMETTQIGYKSAASITENHNNFLNSTIANNKDSWKETIKIIKEEFKKNNENNGNNLENNEQEKDKKPIHINQDSEGPKALPKENTFSIDKKGYIVFDLFNEADKVEIIEGESGKIIEIKSLKKEYNPIDEPGFIKVRYLYMKELIELDIDISEITIRVTGNENVRSIWGYTVYGGVEIFKGRHKNTRFLFMPYINNY